MKLTKSNYKTYLKCPREFWLRQKMPELFPREDSIQGDYLKDMGYQVEALAKKMMLEESKGECEFEKRFETERLLAKADIFFNDSFYEVKATGSVKPDHIDDLAFQKVAAEEAGVPVTQTFLIYLNKEYVLQGTIKPNELLKVEDVTAQVEGRLAETKIRISEAFEYLESEPDRSIANYCREDKLDCVFIRHFHPDLPEYTIFDIGNFRGEKFDRLLNEGKLNILDVPPDFELTERQRKQVNNAISGIPEIKIDKIRELLDSLKYPIYFLDYETANPAVPVYDGYKPFGVIVFQYSIHVMRAEGVLDPEPFWFVSDGKTEPTRDLLSKMRQVIGDEGGTVVVWSAYENTRNNDMGKRCPEFAEYLESVGSRMFDLMKIFSEGYYVHPKFKGSPSIKTVLPVLVPHLSYEELEIKQGSVASAVWLDMAFGQKTDEQRESMKSGLIEYCSLDTKAMAEIMSFLRKECYP